MSNETSYAQQWQRDGAICIPGLLKPESLPKLRQMAEWCLSNWRLCNPETGEPGDSQGRNIFHINNPIYFESRPELLRVLLETVALPQILKLVGEIIEGSPIFRHTTLFMNPIEKDVDGSWHRDSQFLTQTDEEEKRLIESARTTLFRSVQVQIALVPNDDVEVVPRSHFRWDTEEEYRIRKQNNFQNSQSDAMPGARRVALEPGDALFFSSFGLHRGRYHVDKYRRTLMLTYGRAEGEPDIPKLEYFTYQPWFLEAEYLDGMPAEARSFFELFIDTHKEAWLKKQVLEAEQTA
jgi:hypothetical protein